MRLYNCTKIGRAVEKIVQYLVTFLGYMAEMFRFCVQMVEYM